MWSFRIIFYLSNILIGFDSLFYARRLVNEIANGTYIQLVGLYVGQTITKHCQTHLIP